MGNDCDSSRIRQLEQIIQKGRDPSFYIAVALASGEGRFYKLGGTILKLGRRLASQGAVITLA